MLQWMHRLSTSWVASLFMGALALSFVVWGIADVFTGMVTTGLATVGQTEISSTAFQRSYRNFLRNQSAQMGQEITPEMAQQMGLGNVALQQLISRTALDNAVQKLGMTTSDAALAESIRNVPPSWAAPENSTRMCSWAPSTSPAIPKRTSWPRCAAT